MVLYNCSIKYMSIVLEICPKWNVRLVFPPVQRHSFAKFLAKAEGDWIKRYD